MRRLYHRHTYGMGKPEPCPACKGVGETRGRFSADGGRTWRRYYNDGTPVFVPCDSCGGSGVVGGKAANEWFPPNPM